MEFYLTYQGELKANGNAKHKHEIREYFRPQLERLWEIPPLKDRNKYLSIDEKDNIIKDIDGVNYAPLVISKWNLTCQLEVLLLWPDEPGKIIGAGGDIDNRLKTLFDALTCPTEGQIESLNGKGDLSKNPYLCLLEDDKLITSVNVKTHTRLYSEKENNSVYIIIHVILKANILTYVNIDLSA
jgi:hypothetical protein